MTLDLEDRDRLFADLAVRIGFVDLGTVERVRRESSGKPIGQALQAQGLIDREALQLIEALARKRLEAPQSTANAPATLIRVDPASPIPHDPHQTLIPWHASGGLASSADLNESPGGSGDEARFRIIRPHARGGLGAVHLALDRELHREVALKEIHSRFSDDPESRSRFLVEAEITGRLEHPGVVPIYALGAYADGRPYYAMRFIRGESLEDAIRAYHKAASAPEADPGELAVGLRKLLGRFVDICNAISFAHSRGVIHRDLKPSNVMLGDYGETLVVDWGLARVLDTPQTIAQGSQGAIVGTPAYMSPEQAIGDLDQVGRLSDVYALGATLFHLLTGRPPFEGGDINALLARVKLGDFLAPRSASPRVPRPLEAICLKAMSLEPSSRYASAIDLADDLECWQADEPVRAYRDPLSTRVRRWARRNRSMVVGGVVLAVTSATALGISNVLIRAEKKVSDRNFYMAFDAVGAFQDRVSDESQLSQPGLQHLRSSLSRDAARYFGRFVSVKSDDPMVKARVAAAHFHMAKSTAATGSKERAIADYEHAISLYEALARDRPGHPDDRRMIARASDKLGLLQLQAVGLRDHSLRSFRKAVDLLEKLAAADPENVEVRNDLADACNDLGLWFKLGDSLTEATQASDRAFAIRRKLWEDRPLDARMAFEFARSCLNRATLFADRHDFPAAGRDFLQARQILTRLVATFDQAEASQVGSEDRADESEVRNTLAIVLHHLSVINHYQHRMDEARTFAEQARDTREHLVALSTVTEYQRDLASDYHDLGHLNRNIGQESDDPQALDRARQNFDQALAIRRKLVDHFPTVADHRNDLVASLHALAELASDAGNFDQAQACYDQSRKILESLIATNTNINGNLDARQHRSQLAENFELVGQLASKDHRPPEAIAAHLQAISLYANLANASPADVDLRVRLTYSHNNLGEAHRQAGDRPRALQAFEDARRVAEGLVRDQPDDAPARYNLGAVLYHVGITQDDLGALDPAETAFRQAIDHLRVADSKQPGQPQTRRLLAAAIGGSSRALARLGRLEAAATAAQSRRLLWPDDPDELIEVAVALAYCLDQSSGDQVAMLTYQEKSIDALRQAGRHGFRDANALRTHPDLQPLQASPEFQGLLMDLPFPDQPFAELRKLTP